MMYILYKIGEFLTNALPLNAAYWLVEKVADIKYVLSIKDKKILRNNLRVVLGMEKSDIDIHVKNIFRNFCKYLIEFLRVYKMNSQNIENIIKVKGIENLNKALKEQKGVIIFSAHFGSWELGAIAVALRGYKISVIALSHKEQRVNEFFNNRRLSSGVNVIQLGGSVKKTLSALDHNEIVAILCDRDFSKSDLEITFFGRLTKVPKGISIFGLRKGCPLLPAFVVRNPDNTNVLCIEKPIEYQLTGNDREDIENIAQKAIGKIEEYVRKYPGQWLMFEDLWK